MKPTNFAYYLTTFLSSYLPGIAGLSQNTIMSYRDTFSLFLDFCSKNKKIKPEKVTLEHLSRKLIEEYLCGLRKPESASPPRETYVWQHFILSAGICRWNSLTSCIRPNKYYLFQ